MILKKSSPSNDSIRSHTHTQLFEQEPPKQIHSKGADETTWNNHGPVPQTASYNAGQQKWMPTPSGL